MGNMILSSFYYRLFIHKSKIPGRMHCNLGACCRQMFTFGFTAFGGPAVHLAMFNATLCRENTMLSASVFAELLSFASCLPGPTSRKKLELELLLSNSI
jgi:hypothetical protein